MKKCQRVKHCFAVGMASNCHLGRLQTETAVAIIPAGQEDDIARQHSLKMSQVPKYELEMIYEYI